MKYGMLFAVLFFAEFLCLSKVGLAQTGFVYDSRGKRDPFIRRGTSSARVIDVKSELNLDQITLEGIVWDKKEPLAIVNGAVLSVGQVVSGFILHTIDRDKIVLRKDNTSHIIKLAKEDE